MVLTLKSVDEILKCDHSSESYCAVLSCGAVYYTIHWMVLTFETLTIEIKAAKKYFPLVLYTDWI